MERLSLRGVLVRLSRCSLPLALLVIEPATIELRGGRGRGRGKERGGERRGRGGGGREMDWLAWRAREREWDGDHVLTLIAFSM
jgi:hypothetical protein